MAQVLVRQVPDAVHAALRARALRLGVSAESLVRDLLVAEFPSATSSGLGDALVALWAGADTEGLAPGRGAEPHAPPRL